MIPCPSPQNVQKQCDDMTSSDRTSLRISSSSCAVTGPFSNVESQTSEVVTFSTSSQTTLQEDLLLDSPLYEVGGIQFDERVPFVLFAVYRVPAVVAQQPE